MFDINNFVKFLKVGVWQVYLAFFLDTFFGSSETYRLSHNGIKIHKSMKP